MKQSAKGNFKRMYALWYQQLRPKESVKRSGQRGQGNMTKRTTLTFLFGLFAGVIFFASDAYANPLGQWRVSCSVDKGSYEKKGKTHIFRTSSNRCVGGTYKQRSEIISKPISPKQKGTYVFSSTIAISSPSKERFDIFQIHDSRNGCAPPLKVKVNGDGRISLDSEYKIGYEPGDNCVRNKSLYGKTSKARVKRNGTPYKLEITVDFDGKGGFRLWVALNDELQITGEYSAPISQQFYQAKHYYFKHGSYSKNMFPYELTSTGLKVKKVRLK